MQGTLHSSRNLTNVELKKLNIEIQDVYKAYVETIARNKHQVEAHKFETYALYNICNLVEEINRGRYKPKQTRCFVMYNPGPREVFAYHFRDKIIHQFVYNELMPVAEKVYIFDNSACRKGKGTDFAIKRVARFLRSASNDYHDSVYYLKMDVKSFFISLDRKRTLDVVRDLITNKYSGKYTDELLYLTETIISCDVTKNTRRLSEASEWENIPLEKTLFGNEKGFPIGSKLTQLFANLYLNDLDHMIKGRERYYSRYADDMIVVNRDKGHLEETLDLVRKYMKEIGLELNLHKTYIGEAKYGIKYLGVVIKPYYTILGKKRLKKMRESALGFNDREYAYRSIASRKGMVRRYHGLKAYRNWFYSLGEDITDWYLMDHSGKLHKRK